MDFLKELLGEELFAQVEAALAGKYNVELANVADGSYVPAAEVQDKDNQIAELTAQVEELEKQLGGNGGGQTPGKDAGAAGAGTQDAGAKAGNGAVKTGAKAAGVKPGAQATGAKAGSGAAGKAGAQNANAARPGAAAKPGNAQAAAKAKAGGAAGKTNAASTDKSVKGSGEGTDPELEQAIIDELEYAGAKNVKAVRALIDESTIEMGEDGELSGLEEQIEALKKSDPYLFEEEAQSRGANPAVGGNRASADSATRMNRLIRGAAGKQK